MVDILNIGSISNEHNLFEYCMNNPSNCSDFSGYASINNILFKIKDFLNKATNKFINYLKRNLFSYNKKSKLLSISTTAMSILIDAVIATIVRKVVYNALKLGMSALLRISSIRNAFIGTMFNFFLYNSIGKKVLWVLAQIGFNIAGKPKALGTITSGVFKGFLENILCTKTKILGRAVSFISNFSSIGGIIALFFDAMDRNPDGWVKIKI